MGCIVLRRFLTAGVVLAMMAVTSYPCRYSNPKIWMKDPKSSSALFRVVVGNKVGYINRKGEIVIAPAFRTFYIERSYGDFVDGLATLLGPDSEVVIDEKGAIQSGKPAERLVPFSEGLAVHAVELKLSKRRGAGPYSPLLGYIDMQGGVQIVPQYAYAGPFSEGLAAVAWDGSCWVRLNQFSQRYPAPSAAAIFTTCGPRAADSVTEPCRHGYIDKTGKMVIPARYELADDFSEGRAGVRLNGKWGFIDHDQVEVTRFEFDEVQKFSEGKAAVVSYGRWAYIDRSGKWILPNRFSDALPFTDGLAAVAEGPGNYFYIDEKGKKVLPGPYLQATGFVQGLAHVQLAETKWAWIDRTGKVVFGYEWKQDF